MSGLQWEKKNYDAFVLKTDSMILELQPTIDPSDRWFCELHVDYEYAGHKHFTAKSVEEAQQQAILEAFEILIANLNKVAG